LGDSRFFFVVPTTFFSMILLDTESSLLCTIIHLLQVLLDYLISKRLSPNGALNAPNVPAAVMSDVKTNDAQVASNTDVQDVWWHEQQE